MPQPVKIFISSPVAGLEEVRKRAIEAVIRTGHYPLTQEYWSASPNPPLQECLSRVAQCEALILLLGQKSQRMRHRLRHDPGSNH